MKQSLSFIFILFIVWLSSGQNHLSPYIMVLGITQDGGAPQMGCEKKCCNQLLQNRNSNKYISCIAIVDPINNQQWIIDATPDIKNQIQLLEKRSNITTLNGVFITHAHIGHYAGLINFGREVMGTTNLPTYCMPRMKKFLETNGPWSQLVSLNNIEILELASNVTLKLNDRIEIEPFLVPHRDEFSETVGYKISTDNKSLIFIPDIDKWEMWNINIAEYIKTIDYALLDGTFYKDGELGRDMSEIPHPFVKESMEFFSSLSGGDKEKIYFTHFNHTNPLLIFNSQAQQEVEINGFNIAKQGLIIPL